MDFNDLADYVNRGPVKPQNSQLSFMQRAVGTMHKVWCPNVSWRQVVSLCERELGYENRVTWDWYLDHAEFAGFPPDIAFLRDDSQWELSIKDLLYTPINKLSIFKQWKDEQPAEDGLVFPIVNREAIIRKVYNIDDLVDGIVKLYERDGEYYLIQPLKDFAKKYSGTNFRLEEVCDGE